MGMWIDVNKSILILYENSHYVLDLDLQVESSISILSKSDG
jgi:hypothetical protein